MCAAPHESRSQAIWSGRTTVLPRGKLCKQVIYKCRRWSPASSNTVMSNESWSTEGLSSSRGCKCKDTPFTSRSFSNKKSQQMLEMTGAVWERRDKASAHVTTQLQNTAPDVLSASCAAQHHGTTNLHRSAQQPSPEDFSYLENPFKI
ncbi:hypothetical protein JOB18_049138 [Solea senegalensis]|uniref:Uncharacterized protein n=1 Tax=Solea senegalensis TaxID=28829 RepID=A0AAV6TCK7_SOLSE|nr:hypothetical protein JOB18_049138 [Solea senegalensis]